jgi:alpha-L-fucosidase
VPCFAPVDHDLGELVAEGKWEDVFKSSPYVEWYLNSWSFEDSAVTAYHDATYPGRTYESFADEFRERSRGADVADWAPLFRMAGAKYVVPVTKHHDGFLMWHSGVPNPYRDNWMTDRDVIGELAAAVRNEGMRFGLYYSGGLDWTFQPPPIRDIAGLFTNIPPQPEYLDYATAHYHELIDRFLPDVLWNDIGWPLAADSTDIINHYYDKVPHGVVNDRFNMLGVMGGTHHADFRTPEYSTKAADGKWEVCRGIGRSFGYNRMESESSYPSVDENIWQLVDIVARGGNLLLNVGPTAEGQIPNTQAARLMGMGWWLRVNADAIYGTRPGGVTTAADGRPVAMTHTDTTTYLIAQGGPCNELRVECPKPGEGWEVRMMGNSRVLPHTWVDGELRIELADHLPASPATVFAING